MLNLKRLEIDSHWIEQLGMRCYSHGGMFKMDAKLIFKEYNQKPQSLTRLQTWRPFWTQFPRHVFVK